MMSCKSADRFWDTIVRGFARKRPRAREIPLAARQINLPMLRPLEGRASRFPSGVLLI